MWDAIDLVIIFGFVLALISLRRLGRAPGAGGTLPQADQAALERALEQARRLEERIDSLERVLDDDMPGWRRRVSA